MKPATGSTFDDLSSNYISSLVNGFSKADTLIDVFDRYDDKFSVKSAEQERRQGGTNSTQLYQVLGGRQVPPWSKFLNVAQNKQSLVAFISSKIVSCSIESLCITHNRAVILAGCFQDGKETKMITSGGVERMERMCSS